MSTCHRCSRVYRSGRDRRRETSTQHAAHMRLQHRSTTQARSSGSSSSEDLPLPLYRRVAVPHATACASQCASRTTACASQSASQCASQCASMSVNISSHAPPSLHHRVTAISVAHITALPHTPVTHSHKSHPKAHTHICGEHRHLHINAQPRMQQPKVPVRRPRKTALYKRPPPPPPPPPLSTPVRV